MLNLSLECLLKRSEFLAVAKKGEKYITPSFIIQVYERASEGSARYGITASLKIGGAVERNRAKRRLRVLIKEGLSPLSHQGTDYVFIARKEVLKRNFSLMKKELEEALKKIHGKKA